MKRENPLTLPLEYDMINRNRGEIVDYRAQREGQRVDVFLAEQLPELSRSAVQKLLEQLRVSKLEKIKIRKGGFVK